MDSKSRSKADAAFQKDKKAADASQACQEHLVLHVAGSIVEVSLRLVDLAFVLHLLVAAELACALLDAAFGLVGHALHVFAVHGSSPCCRLLNPQGAMIVSSNTAVNAMIVF